MPIKGYACKITVTVWDFGNNCGKTGQEANITLLGIGDSTEYTPSAPSITEIDTVKRKGEYLISVTTAENNYDINSMGGNLTTPITDCEVLPTKWANESDLILDIDTEVDAILVAVNGIGTSGGAAINTDVFDDNVDGDMVACSIVGINAEVYRGSQGTNSFTSTGALDGALHIITHSSNIIDIIYLLKIGGGTTPVAVVWTGYLNQNSDACLIQAWRHDTNGWETIGTIAGQNGSANVVKNLALYSRHAGSAALELGHVYIRFFSNATVTLQVLNTDQLYTTYAVTSRTAGYANGAIWIDTVNGTDASEIYVNGTADKPCRTWANALSLASSLGLRMFQVVTGSTITLSGSSVNYTFLGENYHLALGGQNVSGAYIHGADVTGTGTCPTDDVEFADCHIDGITIGTARFHDCRFNGTIIFSDAADYSFCNGSPEHASNHPIFDFGALVGTTSMGCRHWAGGIEFANVKGSDYISIGGFGKVTLGASCTAGSIRIRGMFEFDKGTSTTTITDDARFDTFQLDQSLVDIGLDHLIAVAESNEPVDNSIIAKLVSKDGTADWSDFDNTTESLEALHDVILTDILTDTGTTLDGLIKDVPTVSEFAARSLPSADYTVVGDTIARVTLVDTTTAVTNNVNAQVKGMDANTLTASALATDAVTEITDAVISANAGSGKLVNEGETLLGNIFLKNSVQVDKYLGLYMDATEPIETATLATITEPSVINGYLRVKLENADWTESLTIVGQFTQAEKHFAASGGNIGPVTGYFICTSSSGTTGKLITVEHFNDAVTILDGGASLYITPTQTVA